MEATLYDSAGNEVHLICGLCGSPEAIAIIGLTHVDSRCHKCMYGDDSGSYRVEFGSSQPIRFATPEVTRLEDGSIQLHWK